MSNILLQNQHPPYGGDLSSAQAVKIHAAANTFTGKIASIPVGGKGCGAVEFIIYP
jgi:hypothetical protein